MILKLKTSNVWMALKKHVITLSNNNNLIAVLIMHFVYTSMHLQKCQDKTRQDKTYITLILSPIS